MAEKSLKIDIPGSISSFQAAASYFELKTKIYKMLFQSKGLEFDHFRNYGYDDDASAIDWKVSLRSQRTVIRQYKEEKDLQVIFLVDVSDSMVFGSTDKLKCEYAAEMVAALSHLVLTSGDKVGFVLFNKEVVQYSLPSAGMNQFYYLVNSISKPEIYNGLPKISNAIDFTTNYFNDKVSAVFIISDFLRMDSKFEESLKLMSNKYETVALMIKDPRDLTLPDTSVELYLEDPVTKEQILVNPSLAKGQYEQFALKQEKEVKDILSRHGIDNLRLLTNESFALPLARFLKERVIGK